MCVSFELCIISILCISHTYLPTHPHTYLPTYLPTYPPTYLPTYLPTHTHINARTNTHTHTHSWQRRGCSETSSTSRTRRCRQRPRPGTCRAWPTSRLGLVVKTVVNTVVKTETRHMQGMANLQVRFSGKDCGEYFGKD